jgi:hypothetical protein
MIELQPKKIHAPKECDRPSRADKEQFALQVSRRLLYLFEAYGVHVECGEEISASQWRNLAILQAMNSQALDISLDGKSLPVMWDSGDIDAEESVRQAIGNKPSAGEHEYIKHLMRAYCEETLRGSKNGKANKTKAAEMVVKHLQRLFPSDYKHLKARSIRANFNDTSSPIDTPVSEATMQYMHNVLKIMEQIDGIATRLKGKAPQNG